MVAIGAGIAALCSAIAGISVYFYFVGGLPKISTLKDYRPLIVSTVYSDDNRKIAEFFTEKRIVIPFSGIPEKLAQAFIAAEDSRFYEHPGIDFLGIFRAMIKNIEAGAITQGGSTITQQVAKSFFLSPERSYSRKIKEAILAYRIDNSLSKQEILYLYLNQIYLGHGAYGVEAAAQNYFGKSVGELTLAECAMLGGMPQAPSRYSPLKNYNLAKQRQIYVLNRMVDNGFVSNFEATKAMEQKLNVKQRRSLYVDEVPDYTEYVRQYLVGKYGREAVYSKGLRAYTAANVEMQKAARLAVTRGLNELDQRHRGYKGPLRKLADDQIEAFCATIAQELIQNPVVNGRVVKCVVVSVDEGSKRVFVRIGKEHGQINVSHMQFTPKVDPEDSSEQPQAGLAGDVFRRGDVIQVKVIGKSHDSTLWDVAIDNHSTVEGALLCMESETGFVKAMVGGREFKESQFNRALQSRRQPGSAFKPIVYAAALDKGYTPATTIIDSSLILTDTTGAIKWKPKNYEEKFYGATLFRTALEHSRNVVTIKILKDIGVDYVIAFAKKLGIQSPLTRDLSLGLGTSGVSMLELVRAYAVFNNQGGRVKPIFITKVVDRDGNVLEKTEPESEKVLEKSTAYIMTSLLQGVIQRGTGQRVKALGRPAAGKTGTTNDLNDAWFLGYTPRYVAGVWVGYDDRKSLGAGETGSRAASPIWLEFMQAAQKNEPIKDFSVPEGVVFAKIDIDTGLLAIPESINTFFECFKEGTVPTEYAKKTGTITESEDFFKEDM